MPNPTNIGCFGHCDTITTGVIAPADGVYTVSTTFNGQLLRIDTPALLTGEEVTFSASLIPENYQFTAWVSDSLGTMVPDSYIQFETKVII